MAEFDDIFMYVRPNRNAKGRYIKGCTPHNKGVKMTAEERESRAELIARFSQCRKGTHRDGSKQYVKVVSVDVATGKATIYKSIKMASEEIENLYGCKAKSAYEQIVRVLKGHDRQNNTRVSYKGCRWFYERNVTAWYEYSESIKSKIA